MQNERNEAKRSALKESALFEFSINFYLKTIAFFRVL